MPSFPAYYRDTFDPEKNHERVLGVEDQYLMAEDFNVALSIERDARTGLGNAVFRDGQVISGAAINVNPTTGVTVLETGGIYVQGRIRNLAAATVTIPVEGEVLVGVVIEERVITSVDDPTLIVQNFSTLALEAHGQPLLPRLQQIPRWGSTEEALVDTPTVAYRFYAVYKVVDGLVVDTRPPTENAAIVQLIERYDRESNGHYIARGCELSYLSTTAGAQTYSLSEGTANVSGRKLDRLSAERLTYVEDPDLERIDAEPHTFADGGSHTVVITLNRTPVDAIHDVSCLVEKTVTLTRGTSTGGRDALPDAQIQSIVEVKQGGTTYVAVTSYNQLGDEIDWSPAGAEPSIGSTYTVKYRYKKSIAPASSTSTTVTVTDATIVTNSEVDIDYSWKMPRYDVIALDRNGTVQRIKGVSSPYSPQRPRVPVEMLEVAQIEQRWTSGYPVVSNTGVKAVPNSDLKAMRDAIVLNRQELARLRLQTDASARNPAAFNGIFADNFDNDDQRDAGQAQTASIVDGKLTLSIAATLTPLSPANTGWTLNYDLEEAITQPLRTGSWKINPYQSFAPIPARLLLTPSLDEWSVVQTTWASPVTQQFSTAGNNNTREELLSSTSKPAEFLRTRSVDVRIDGFAVGEALASLTFDGISVMPGGAAPVANSNGVITTTFNVPANIPVGVKWVTAVGVGGSAGSAPYVGRGTLTVEERRLVTSVFNPPPAPSNPASSGPVEWCLQYPITVLDPVTRQVLRVIPASTDPLFQSFTAVVGFHLGAWAFRFAAIGDRSKPVVLQLRETVQGVPGPNVLASATIDMQTALTSSDTTVQFPSLPWLEAGREYAMVWLTDDANHAIATAEIGKYDQVNQRWVTQQPYQVGVFGSSSNNAAWSIHQETDAYFKAHKAKITSTTRSIPLGTIAATAVTDILVKAGVEIPQALTGVDLVFTRPNGDEIKVAPGAVVSLDQALTETLTVSAVLKGVEGASPILFPNPQVVLGALASSNTYISRAFDAGTGVTMHIEIEAYTPGSSTIVPAIQQSGGTWTNATLISSTDLGEGWHRLVYELAAFTAATTRVKLTLNGSALSRPEARSLVVMPLDI